MLSAFGAPSHNLYISIVPAFLAITESEREISGASSPNPVIRGKKAFKLRKVPVISIVDDDASIRDAVKSLVRSLGYAAATFSSAEEYLESGLARESSCLITDLGMPGMTGADLQQRLVEEWSITPIIIMTASRDEELRRRVLNAGARGFLRKPFRDQQLIDCIENALKRASDGNVPPTMPGPVRQ